jgi:hypothetical protein
MARHGVASLCTLAMVAMLSLAVVAAPATAAVTGTLHVEYTIDGKLHQDDTSSSIPSTSDVTVSWTVSSDIPLAGSSVPYRYSTRTSKRGTVSATANGTQGKTTCTGALTADSNGTANVSPFEFDFATKGSKLLDKGTLKGTSPVPLTSGFVAQFSDRNGTGCTGYQPVTQIGGGPDDPDGNVLLKVDLARLAKSRTKSQTFDVGLDKSHPGSTSTDTIWSGTVVVTLQK